MAGRDLRRAVELPAEEPAELVLAAGGVLVRDGPEGEEVALVHRPKHRDWSLPKGKLDPGEAERDAALREVEEETGFSCTLEEALGHVRYVDRHNRPKQVAYWLMRARGGSFRPTDEVDDLRWLPPGEALEMLTYELDREILRRAMDGLG